MKQKFIRVLPHVVSLVAVVFLLVSPAFAQLNQQQPTLREDSFRSLRLPLFTSADPATFFVLLGRIINFLLLVAGIVAFFYILWGGFLYLTSGGDQTGAQKGRTMIANALIGIVIIFVSYALVNFFVRFLAGEGRNEPGFGYNQSLDNRLG